MPHRRQKQRQKLRLPGPLKLPKSYRPRYLSPAEEGTLAARLSKVPERWNEGYGDDMRMSQLFVTKKVSKKEIDQIVARLSATKKEELEPAKEDEDIFIFKEEEEEQDGERKLDPEEVERLVERLSQTSLRSETKSLESKKQNVPRLKLTQCEMESLTTRLSKPRVYVDTNEQKSREGRFIGRKMTKDEIIGLVQRLACKRINKQQQMETGEERNLKGYFAAWTPCDAHFRMWNRANRAVFNANDRYYKCY